MKALKKQQMENPKNKKIFFEGELEKFTRMSFKSSYYSAHELAWLQLKTLKGFMKK